MEALAQLIGSVDGVGHSEEGKTSEFAAGTTTAVVSLMSNAFDFGEDFPFSHPANFQVSLVAVDDTVEKAHSRLNAVVARIARLRYGAGRNLNGTARCTEWGEVGNFGLLPDSMDGRQQIGVDFSVRAIIYEGLPEGSGEDAR